MSMTHRRIALSLTIGALLAVATARSASAQRADSFRTESLAAFVEDFDAYLTAGKRASADELSKGFQRRASSYAPAQLADVMRVANAMLAKGMSPAPYFEDYLAALAVVPYAGEESAATFTAWHGALAALLAGMEGRRFKPYANFLDFSRAFFAEQSLRSASGLTWFARGERFDVRVEGSEPVVYFDTVRLVGVRRLDSISIEATRGRYRPSSNTFEGRGGRVYWDRHGLTEAYAYLGRYEVDVTKSLYSADSVRMTFPTYFGDDRVYGRFSDKISSATADRTGTYPRFTSYDAVLTLDDLGEGLTYQGGFRLQGTTVFGDSEGGPDATVTLRNEAGKVIYRGVAPAYVIRRGERIVGDQVRSTFYHGVDSIFHPAVKLRYDIPDRLLTLTRGERAASRNPFYSSLQDVNVNVEEVKIFVPQDSVLFGEKKLAIAKQSDDVSIESLQYFSGAAYNRYQNIATYNPLSIIKAVAEREGRTLDALSLAKKIDSRFTLESVKTLYFDLVSDGFIGYDIDAGTVTVRDKVFHFVEAAQGKVDFDAMRIRSNTKETNATFDLVTGTMLLNGVKNLELSRKQRVAIVPTEGQMLMQANRNVDFDGQLIAGYGVFEGKDMHFEYEPYQIVLDSVRYLDLYVPEEVEEGVKQPEPKGIGSRIEHLAGTLLIDAPRNKSGREDIAVFPSLQSEGLSFVYYDLPSNNDTAYTRDSFYFALDPFSFNSLDRFTEDDVRFAGTMYSADIFPPYPEDVYVREGDRSLGHATETASEGWATYKAKGNYAGKLDLSNRGYFGEGTLNYLTATVNAEDFLFEPKRMTATAERFDMEERRGGTPATPKATGVDVSLDWLPYQDSMYVRSEEEPFDLFAAEGHTLEGQLILTPSGLKAQGVHDWPAATLRSELHAYEPFAMTGDTLAIAIKTADGEGVALEADRLNGRTDFDAQRGSYAANDEFLVVDLPANLYQTSMNEFDWDMESQEIEFKSKPGQLGSFTSTDPDRDSLFFEGASARYNLAGSAIEIGGVPFIASADALIYTETGDVEVALGGELGTLTNARIVADTVTKYHVIDSATVNVRGRKEYSARGYYRYDLPGKQQRVLFEEVLGQRVGKGSRAEKDAVTRASGEVSGAQDFYIDARTRFKGAIGLDASRQALEFDGFAKLDAPGIDQARWFSVNTLGDKADLRLPYDLPQAPEGDDLHTGIFLSRESLQAYPRAFMPTHTGQDRSILDVSAGLFDYDAEAETFRFGDSLRVTQGAGRGALMTARASDGAVEASGPLELGSKLDYITVQAAGELTTGFEKSGNEYPALKTKAMIGIDLIIPDKLLNLVAADIQASGFDAPDLNYGSDAAFLQRALRNWVRNPADTSALVAARGGQFVLPKGELDHSFVLPRVELIYNGDYQSFVSKGSTLDLAYLNGNPVGKRLTGYLEIKMPGSGDDRLYLYLKTPSEAWYFFGFKQGILNVASSSPRFMESLEGLKSKEVAIKMDDGEIYEIAPVNAGTANAFVNRVKEAQRG